MSPRRRRFFVLGLGLLAAGALALLDWADDRPADAPVAAVETPKKPRRVLPTRFFNPDALPPALAAADEVDPPAPAGDTGMTDELPAPLDPAILRVAVDDPFDSPTVWVNGCGLWNRPLARGEWVTIALEPGEWCTIDAWRMDGAFRALALPEAVYAEPGERVSLEFVLPDWEMGGMGFAFGRDEGDVVVYRTYEGTPAWDAGLRPGDRIVGVDGEPTEDMSDNEFVSFGTGPAGTLVEVDVLQEDGGVETLEIERALLGGV